MRTPSNSTIKTELPIHTSLGRDSTLAIVYRLAKVLFGD